MIESSPWTEKYRPSSFDNIILDEVNKDIFESIIENNYFPNMLFYGPPGTGKTTTIINLINNYQEKYNMQSKALIIHLNASDERGIDIIRNNILNFVNSDILFIEGVKFVILDEVDYMTKVAQQALKCLIQSNTNNVRFCLICNYISKIDISLQSEFIKIRFNNLPKNDIFKFLKNIITLEKLNVNDKTIYSIIEYHDNDIRSMINYIQSTSIKKNILIDNELLEKMLLETLKNNHYNYIKSIENIQKKCSMDLNILLNKYINFLITKFIDKIDSYILSIFELNVHNISTNIFINFDCIYYAIIEYKDLFNH
jgi:replication factor C subunit 3/5